MLNLYTASLIALLRDSGQAGTWSIARASGNGVDAARTVAPVGTVPGFIIRMGNPTMRTAFSGWPLGDAPYWFVCAPGAGIQVQDTLSLAGATYTITAIDDTSFPGYVIAAAGEMK